MTALTDVIADLRVKLTAAEGVIADLRAQLVREQQISATWREAAVDRAGELQEEMIENGKLREAVHKARVAVQFGRVLSASIKEDYDRDPHVERFDVVADEFEAALTRKVDGGK